MSNKLKGFLKIASYTMLSNLLSAFISALAVLLLPRFMGVDEYGYYQLFLFYASYCGVTYLGLCDGIYLRYGGIHYKEYDKPLIGTQFWILGIYEVILFTAIAVVAIAFGSDVNKTAVIGYTCIAGVGMCFRWFLYNVLQASARIKEYAFMIILEKLTFILGIAILIMQGKTSYHCVILMDVIAKYISLLYGVFQCRDIVFCKMLSLKKVYPEIRENVCAGFKLLMAALASTLITGVVRFGVQQRWDIETFSKVSLTLSISNMFMQAIAAIAVVLYPLLRRTKEENLPRIYSMMRVILMGIVFACFIFYYPFQKFLGMWLPQYTESLRYAAILFPICVYESKMSMLVNTYYKTLRMENLLMKCNILTLLFSVVLTLISTTVFSNVTFAILSILIALIFRCILSEFLLARKIEIRVGVDILLELCMSLAFIVCNWFLGFLGMILYIICYLIYLVLKKDDIKASLQFLREKN